MSTPEIIPWPEQSDFERCNDHVEEPCFYTFDKLGYERARAEAAMSRLRVAVEALKRISNYEGPLDQTTADEALASIGELKGEI